jgi:hypothetical protein
MPRIVLHIDRLVLRGVERADAAAVSEALQAELRTQLAGGRSPLATQGSTHALQAGKVRVPQDGGAAALGHAVATRIAAPADNKAGAP